MSGYGGGIAPITVSGAGTMTIPDNQGISTPSFGSLLDTSTASNYVGVGGTLAGSTRVRGTTIFLGNNLLTNIDGTSGKASFDATMTAGGTTGARTINKPSGSVNFAAAATSLVVTNSLVSTSSIIIATVMTNDTTLQSCQAVAASGSFTLHANAAATAETKVAFWVLN